MTTTLPELESTVKKLKEAVPSVDILVGGAVVTQDYAMKSAPRTTAGRNCRCPHR